MAETVDVRSVDALADLKDGLNRFAGDARAELDAIEAEIRRTEAWLADRIRHWQRVVARCQEETARAASALRACERSGDRDHPPDCRRQAAYLAECRRPR